MSSRKPKTRLDRARQSWDGFTTLKKTLITIGACASAVIAISGAWGLASNTISENRPWAERQVEIIVAGLQLESLQAKQFQITHGILQLENEERRDGKRFEAYKKELLNKLKRERELNERVIRQIEQRK